MKIAQAIVEDFAQDPEGITDCYGSPAKRAKGS
jgi:hypothetical protein